ncbi:hypothetical protein MUCCIDRAFT_158626 [Mucor lusitanicus CBS 277.49]|uniref:Uncharacterized protein n=1 Tax=Mucor lusitanicus CBS 277.49 TaxID=747725 RepID=A0A168PY97_MUCCL|nr:hypothetical protein MUCCIDRAFT_158626 [Mucor lusitanicus CBS 277.49]
MCHAKFLTSKGATDYFRDNSVEASVIDEEAGRKLMALFDGDDGAETDESHSQAHIPPARLSPPAQSLSDDETYNLSDPFVEQSEYLQAEDLSELAYRLKSAKLGATAMRFQKAQFGTGGTVSA